MFDKKEKPATVVEEPVVDPCVAPDEIDLEDVTSDSAENKAAAAQSVETSPENEVSALNSRLQSMNDKYLRLMAEFDNFKRRTSKEYDRMVDCANERLMTELIEVRENFQRALAIVPTPETLETFFNGLKLIFEKYETILARNGLECFADHGEEFNAELHDAMLRAPHDNIPEDHIAQIFEKGYKLKGKIIRHAKVVVSGGPAESSAEPLKDEPAKKCN